MFRILIISFFAFFFSQCTEPPVVFTADQPDGLAPRAYFEPVYRGIFQCESDSALVYVKAKTIYKEKEYDFKVGRAEIDAYDGAALINGELWIEEFADPIPVTVEGDSVSGNLLLRDTIFNLSRDHVLKYFRGHQILNKKLADGKWEVLILSVDYDLDLRLSKAILPDDLQALEKITPVTDISTEEHEQILLSPTISAFNEILRQGLIFQECDLYKRIKFPTEI